MLHKRKRETRCQALPEDQSIFSTLLFPPKIWLITPFRVATRERYSAVFLSGQHQSRLPDATARVPIFFFFPPKRTYSRRHSFSRFRRINPDSSIIKHNEAGHLGGARCSGGVKTSSAARDRSIDYTPGKVRDPRSGWQAMCTDPSRSSKQCYATACASMHASDARANRPANHPRNARFSFFISDSCVTVSRIESVSNSGDVPATFTFPSAAAPRRGTRIAKFSF